MSNSTYLMSRQLFDHTLMQIEDKYLSSIICFFGWKNNIKEWINKTFLK